MLTARMRARYWAAMGLAAVPVSVACTKGQTSGSTVANVKNATVVVVNPTHIACALRYDEEEGDEAPLVVAVGEGDLARRIVEAAHAYGVPVLRDVPLARALVELTPGDQIPEELYEAVAEILREAWAEPR